MIFELLFVLLFLGSVIAALIAVVLVVRGSRRAGLRVFRSLAVGWAAYLLVVGVAAATTPQRVLAMGNGRCFDEMCFAVVKAEAVPQLGQGSEMVRAEGSFYVVTVQATSHSRGRAQGEGGLHALLWDSGKYYGVSPAGQHAWESEHGATPGLSARLQPGESVLSVLVFDVPKEATAPGLVLSHGFTPGYFVIGECPLFHKPTIMPLPPV